MGWMIPAAVGAATWLWGRSKKGKETLHGKKAKYGQVQTRLPSQVDFINRILRPGGGIKNNQIYKQGAKAIQDQIRGPKQDFYNAIESPLMRQLQQQILPGIMNQLGPNAGTGSGGLAGSSALNQALAQAVTNFSTNLASQRSQFLQNQRNQGISNSLAYAQAPYSIGLSAANQSTFQPTYSPATPGLLQQALPGIVNAGANYAFGNQASNQGFNQGNYQIG